MPALVVLALAWAHYAAASYQTANCTVSSDDWMDNSLGQNPCRVAEFLSYPCNAYTVIPLSNGSLWYAGAANNPCECNTVMYNLLSACSLCQGGSQQGWQTFSQNCSRSYIGQYTEEILSTTAVPHWAYIDISGTNLLDINEAKAAGDAPETAGGLASATVTATKTVRVTTTASGTSGKGSSIIGPVVGGVVGGVAFIALAAAAGFYFMIRRRDPQIQMLSKSSVLGSPSTVPGSSILFTGASSSPTRHTTGPAGKPFETYEPQTQHSTLTPTRFPNPPNNGVTMYVTPSNGYIQESGRNNMYRTM